MMFTVDYLWDRLWSVILKQNEMVNDEHVAAMDICSVGDNEGGKGRKKRKSHCSNCKQCA